MKKLLALLALGGFCTAAAATPDCGTIVLINLRTLSYRTKAEFPDAPKRVDLNVWDAKKPMAMCGVTFTPQGNTLKVKVEQNDYFGYLTTPGRRAGGIYLAGSTPGLFGQTGLDVTFTLMDLYTTYSATAMVPREMQPTTAIALRIDGGKLQPLFWPGVGSKEVAFPKTAKIYDVYVKSQLPTNWERATVNLKTHELTVYRKFAFPAK